MFVEMSGIQPKFPLGVATPLGKLRHSPGHDPAWFAGLVVQPVTVFAAVADACDALAFAAAAWACASLACLLAAVALASLCCCLDSRSFTLACSASICALSTRSSSGETLCALATPAAPNS